ncbi:RluA family pseudouridine synthase [Carnobacteriaceae bacterium zg-C25]|nr:RluA family pseudouridine synthase [Carnobacteriaceae bacterium zg-C25]
MVKQLDFIAQDALGRIDKALVDLTSFSRSQIQQLLKKDAVVVNGSLVKANYKIQKGDTIVISIPEAETIDVVAENIPIDIVYEDDDIVIVNKASGMVVHPSVGHDRGTLVNGLLYHVKQLATSTGEIRPGIVHRIDKDTSGLLVVAKHSKAHEQLSQQFQTHDITREYVALVHGEVEHETGTIDAPLARDKYDRLKWRVQEGGKRAVTHFTVLERYEGYTLIQLRLETGRTHQIRAHMHFIGFDLVGDPVYSKYHDDKSYGQFLHAKTLGFKHPTTNEFVLFNSELPKTFLNQLETLVKKEQA